MDKDFLARLANADDTVIVTALRRNWLKLPELSQLEKFLRIRRPTERVQVALESALARGKIKAR